MSNRATCEDCQHLRIDHWGNGRTEPEEVEIYCEPPGLDDETIEAIWNKYIGAGSNALECPGFKGILIKKCNQCGKPLGPPDLYGEPAGLYTYQVEHQDHIFDRLFFCSKACKEKSFKDISKMEEYI